MFRQFARLLAVSLVLVCHPTVALQDHRVSTDSAVQGVHFYGLCDAFTKSDGAQVYLSSPRGPMQLQEGKPEQLYDIPNRSLSRIAFVRLFEHPTEPDSRYAIAWLDAKKMNGMGIYLLTPDEARLVCHIGERMRQPNFYQSENGDIFVSSRSGVVYWWDRQQLRRFAMSIDPGLTIDLRKLFRRVEFTSWPGGPVCCYSVANPKYHERALFDIAVADPETGWRTISLDGRVTGPATMTNAHTSRMLQYDRWINVDLASGEVTEEQFASGRSSR